MRAGVLAPCARLGVRFPMGARNLSHPRRTVVRMALDIPRLDGRFEVVSDYQPAGDQPTAIDELERRVRRGDRTYGAAGRDRHGQERHDRVADRAAAAAGAGARAQQDPVRPARQGVPRAAAAQRGGVFRQLLRLLPARGLHPADRHLHREGLVDQRGGRAAAALGHDVAADPARRHRGGDGERHLRPGDAAGVPGPVGPGRGRPGGRPGQAAAAAGRHPVHAERHGLPARARSGSGATPWRSSRRTKSWRCGWSCSATRWRSSTTCTRSPARWCARSRAGHLPGHPLRRRTGADGAGHPRHRGRAGRAAGRAGAAGQAAGGAAPADADHVRHGDDAPGRLLQRHRELLDAHRRPVARRPADTVCSTTSRTTSSPSSTSRT